MVGKSRAALGRGYRAEAIQRYSGCGRGSHAECANCATMWPIVKGVWGANLTEHCAKVPRVTIWHTAASFGNANGAF